MILLNNVEIKPTIFPDKTSQVWHLPDNVFSDHSHNITWKFENEAELFHICQLVTLLRRRRSHSPINLDLPYLPYGRQDHDIHNDSSFALHSFAEVLNMLEFNKVKVYDPHSDKASKLINNLEAKMPGENVEIILKEHDYDLICYPDKGARKKYRDLIQCQYIWGEKIRNQETGEITGYSLIGSPKGRRVLIVDDICDGGATFVNLARLLYDNGASYVSLYVSHGLFTKGIEVLTHAGIQNIFTKDKIV